MQFIGSATGTTTVTIPTHQAGDLLIAHAYRDGNTTAPNIPAGWTAISNAGNGNTNSSRIAYIIATGPGTAAGTWTNATGLEIRVYRPDTGKVFLAPTANAQATGATSSVQYPALTLPGQSWVAAFAGHRSVNTTLENAPTGMVQRATRVDTVCEIAGFDTNGPVSSWSLQSVALGGTASGWMARILAIQEATPAQLSASEAGSDTAAIEITVGSSGGGSTRPWTLDDLAVAPLSNHDTSATSSLSLTGASVNSIADLQGAESRRLEGAFNTGSALPTYSATAMPGGRPGIFFEDNRRTLRSSVSPAANYGLPTASAVFMAFAHNNGGGYNNQFFGVASNTASGSNLQSDSDFGGLLFHWPEGEVGYKYRYDSIDTRIYATPNAPHVISLVGTATDTLFSLDGNPMMSYGEPLHWVGHKIGVGADAHSLENGMPGLTFGQSVILGYTPTTDERQRIEGLLAWKWGSVAGLPAGHPYKTAAPTVAASGGPPTEISNASYSWAQHGTPTRDFTVDVGPAAAGRHVIFSAAGNGYSTAPTMRLDPAGANVAGTTGIYRTGSGDNNGGDWGIVEVPAGLSGNVTLRVTSSAYESVITISALSGADASTFMGFGGGSGGDYPYNASVDMGTVPAQQYALLAGWAFSVDDMSNFIRLPADTTVTGYTEHALEYRAGAVGRIASTLAGSYSAVSIGNGTDQTNTAFAMGGARIGGLSFAPETNTATLAATESGSDSGALTASVQTNATLAAADSGSDAAAFAAEVRINAALSTSDAGSDQASLNATVSIAGSMAASEAGVDSASMAAQVRINAALAAADAGSDSAALTAGPTPVTAQLTASETGVDSAAFLATMQNSAQLGASEAGPDVAALQVAMPLSAQMAASEAGSDAAAIVATLQNSAQLAAQEVGSDTAAIGAWANAAYLQVQESGPDIAAMVSTVRVNAALAVTEPGPDSATISASVQIRGALAVSEVGSDTALIISGGGNTAALAAEETGSDSAALTATMRNDAALQATEAAGDTAAIAARLGINASVQAQEAGADQASMAAGVSIRAQMAALETGSDQAAINARGSIAATLQAQETGSDSASLTAALQNRAAFALTEQGQDSAAIASTVRVGAVLGAVESGADSAAVVVLTLMEMVLAALEEGADQAIIQVSAGLVAQLEASETGQDTAAIALSDVPQSAYYGEPAIVRPAIMGAAIVDDTRQQAGIIVRDPITGGAIVRK